MANYNIKYQVIVYQPGGHGRISSPAKLQKTLTKYGRNGYKVVATESTRTSESDSGGESMIVIMERTW